MVHFHWVAFCVILIRTTRGEISDSFDGLNSSQNDTNDTLVFAQVIFRHGARNIDKIYPNDPLKDESNWPEGIGQLTNEGKRQLYKLGQYFRRRYNDLIGQKYSAKKVYIQSTDKDRVIMSAQTALAGLYYPNEEEKWNEHISWVPVPVHTVPESLDYILKASAECPKYKRLYDQYMRTNSEVQRIYTEHADLFPYLAEKCGSNINTIPDVYWLYNTFQIEQEQNKPLQDWAKKAIEPNGVMEYIATFDYKTYTDEPPMARLKSGFLLKEILEHFAQKVNSTLEPDRSLWMYSAHDITITNMLNALGIYELHIAPYASALIFELFKTAKNEHYIQIFYRKSEEEYPTAMRIPNCDEKCSLEQFTTLYSAIIPGDYRVECFE